MAPAPDGSAAAAAAKTVPLANLRALVRGRQWAFQDLDIRATIGTGTFGRVRMVKVKNHADKSPMALKILKKAEVIRLKQVEHVKGERMILSMLEHPFIVNLLVTFQDAKRLFLLQEFVNGGELFTHLRKEGRLPNDQARFYASEIILAFAYLHNMNVIYRDLKPENSLIDCEGHLKLTDFGFSKVVEDRTWTLCGTPEYLAPEIIQSKGHGKPVDWWALGVLIYEMLAGFPPFFHDTPVGIYEKVLAGRVDYQRHFDHKATDLIKHLLTRDSAKRLCSSAKGAEEAKRHKWFKGLDWDLVLNRDISPPYVPNVKSVDDTSMFDRYPESTEASAPPVAAKDQDLFQAFTPDF